MKRLTLSKPQVERKFNQLALVILLVLCFQGVRAQTAKTLEQFLDLDECNVNYGLALSFQITLFSQKLYDCNILDENIKDYENRLDSLSQKQLMHYDIYKAFQLTRKGHKLEFGKSNLPEYFLYKKFTNMAKCGDYKIFQKLGYNFNDCDYCVQSSNCSKKEKQKNEKTNTYGPLRIYSVRETYVEAFQLLWNCNNPNNQVEVTGVYDETTEKQLLQTNAYGFDKVCMMCEVENCGVCSKNYSECFECKQGYILNDNVCIRCPLNNCTKCSQTCDECIDSSDLCIKCNPELNYYIKEGDRFRCYNRCPLYFEPSQSTQDPLKKYIECVKSENYTSDLEEADKIINEAKNRCPKQQYWDVESKQCYKCTNNCISCNDKSNCLECEPDYYLNDNSQTCSPCHPSCQKCTGPLSRDCLFCSSGERLFPDQNGICEENATDILQQQKILSQNEIFGNLQVCKQLLNQKRNYSVEFSQKFSINDSKWENIIMMSKNSCTFLEFQNRYKYFQKNKQNCEDKEISQSTIGKNGDLVAIYSMLLSQSRAQISSNQVNPQTLVEYAIKENFFSSSYLFQITTPTFACSNLQCISQLDSLLYGFSSSDNKKEITIKVVKEIVLTSENQTPLNCFKGGQQVNQNTVEDIEKIVNNSQYTLNTGSKQYFILYACGKSQQGSFAQKPFLVQKYLGNGFFEVINVSNPLPSQVEVISLYGASNEQNTFLKKCDSKLSNSLSAYQVQKVSIVQVVESNLNADKSELMFQQYNNKVESSNTDPAKCTCVETKDYILANENQSNQFITVITPQNKILTESINVKSINHILKKYKIDAEIMKTNRLSITKIQADKIFYEYIQETVESAKKCYGVSNSTPLCMINVLADLLFSNNLQCFYSQQIKSYVKNSDFRGLNDFIKKQSWCNRYQKRCLKAQQTMKSCI